MRKKILALAMAVVIAGPVFSSFSYADRPGDRRDDRGPQWHHRDDGPRGGWGAHRPERNHFAGRGYDFRPGRPMPPAYRGERYRIYDWRGYGLPRPPRGHYWNRVDGNYILVAVATGVITSIILNNALD